MWKRLVIFVLLALITTAASWSMLQPGMFYTHDYIHGARIAEMSRILKDGQFPPRWSQNFGSGYGMPLFQFYGPLPFMVGALINISLNLVATTKVLFAVTTLVNAIGGFFLGKKLYGIWGGLVTAALITLIPYRALNLFVRGALSEAFGQMVFPWILYFGMGVVDGIRHSRVWLIISLLVLLLSHNLSAMIFLPASVVWLLANNWIKSRSRKKLVKTLFVLFQSYALSGLLAAFYVLPSYLEKGLTVMDWAIVGDYFDYRVHFLTLRQFFLDVWGYGGSSYGPDDGISFYLGSIHLLLLMIVTIFLALKALRRENFNRFLIPGLALGMLLFSLYMSHYSSEWIWSLIKPFKYLQFPWRWLGVANIFLGLIGGSLFLFIKTEKTKAILSVCLVIFTVLANMKFFQPNYLVGDASDYYYQSPDRIRIEMSKVLPDYLPVGFQLDLPPVTRGTILYGDANSKDLKVNNLSQNSKETVFNLSSQVERGVTLAIASYPGWRVEIDRVETPLNTSPEGLLMIEGLPPGEHHVRVWFDDTTTRTMSDLISLVGLGFFAYLLYSEYKQR